MRIGMWMGAPLRALGVVAVMALAACGGGSSSDEKPAFGVNVAVDGTADAANPLTAGETSTIEVPSGATLVFESAGETRWEPTATGSSYEVNGFSFTSKSMTVSSNAGGSLVVVFTDKADASQKATLNVTVAPKEFQRVAPVDGQVATWSLDWTDTLGDTTRQDQFVRTVLMDNGRYGTEAGTTPGTYSVLRVLYDAQDRNLGYVDTGTGVECLFDQPVAGVSYPLQVGKSWSGDAKRDCERSSVVFHYSNAVEAYERITVPQGTHDTLRIRSESRSTVTFSNPDFPVLAFTSSMTCWWAVDLGRNVKCKYSDRFDDGSTDGGTSELKGLTP